MKKSLKKTVKNIVIIIAVLLVTLVAARNQLLKAGVRRAIQAYTGFGLELDAFRVGLFKPTFEIKGLKLVNPEDFPEPAAFEVKRLFVRYDLPSVFSDEVHVPEVTLDVPRVVLVEKEDGETNLGRMAKKGKEIAKKDGGEGEPPAGGGTPPEGEPPQEPPAPKQEKPPKKARIDLLTITVGTVEVHKYEAGNPDPETDTYQIGETFTFKNVTSPEAIAAQVATEIMVRRAQKEMQKLAKEHQKDIDKAAARLDEVGQGLGDQFKGLVEGLGGAKKK